MQKTFAALAVTVLLTGCATMPSRGSIFSTLPRVSEVDERYLS